MPRLDAAKRLPAQLTPRLGLRKRTGFFDSYETPDKRLRRIRLLKQSDVRQQVRRVLDAAAPARRAAALRAARAGREQALPPINVMQRLRERRQQQLDVAAAREQFKKVEQRQQPLSVKSAAELLRGRPVSAPIPSPRAAPPSVALPGYSKAEALERLRRVERRQQPKVRFRLPLPSQSDMDQFFEEATRRGGVPAKIIENIYRGAEKYRDHPERGRDPDKFITHEITERFLVNKGVPAREAHDWVARAEGRAEAKGVTKFREVEKRQQPPAKFEASLRREFETLKKQWGSDAEGMSLTLGDVGGSLGGYYPGANNLTLDLDVIRDQLGRRDKSGIASLEGKDFDSLAHAVLRHEFSHAVTAAREKRGALEGDKPLESAEGRGFWLIDEAHGKAWNEMNVAIQGSGSELDMPSIGLPPELRRTQYERARLGQLRPDAPGTRKRLREVEARQQPEAPSKKAARAARAEAIAGFKKVERRQQPPVPTFGRYAQAEYNFEDLPPDAFKPTKMTTKISDSDKSVPLTLSLSTATGRMLADWQRQYREVGYSGPAGDRRAAKAFDEQTSDLKGMLREELEEAGYDEKRIDVHITGLLERTLRQSELYEQAIKEWQAQNPDADTGAMYADRGAVPPDDVLEEIDGQVEEAIAEEFKVLNKLLEYQPKSVLDRARDALGGVTVPVGAGVGIPGVGFVGPHVDLDLGGLSRMAVGTVEVLDAISRPMTSGPSALEQFRGEREQRIRRRSTLKIGGIQIGSADLDEALPDLLKGFEDYFGGGYQLSRPLIEAAIPKPLEKPLSAGLKYTLTAPIRASEEVAELLGVEARGKVSGKLAAKMGDEFAEDLIAEIVNPAALLVALPFLGHGINATMSTRRVAVQMISNLLGTGLEPGATGAFARWTTRLAKFGPRSALARAPASIRGTRAYTIAMKNLRSEAGGMRVAGRNVRLVEEAERALTLADDGKKLTRRQLLSAAKEQGIGPGVRRNRMSNEAILSELRSTKRMLERLADMSRLIRARPRRLNRATRRLLEGVVEKGGKATLKELRHATRRAGLEVSGLFRRPAQLTAEEADELARLQRPARGPALAEATEEARFAELQAETAKARAAPATDLELGVMDISDRIARDVDDLPGKLGRAVDEIGERSYELDMPMGAAFLMDDGKFVSVARGEAGTHTAFVQRAFRAAGESAPDDPAYMNAFMKATRSVRVTGTKTGMFVDVVGPINAAQRTALVKTARDMKKVVATASRIADSPAPLREFEGDAQGLRRFLDDLMRDPPEFGRGPIEGAEAAAPTARATGLGAEDAARLAELEAILPATRTYDEAAEIVELVNKLPPLPGKPSIARTVELGAVRTVDDLTVDDFSRLGISKESVGDFVFADSVGIKAAATRVIGRGGVNMSDMDEIVAAFALKRVDESTAGNTIYRHITLPGDINTVAAGFRKGGRVVVDPLSSFSSNRVVGDLGAEALEAGQTSVLYKVGSKPRAYQTTSDIDVISGGIFEITGTKRLKEPGYELVEVGLRQIETPLQAKSGAAYIDDAVKVFDNRIAAMKARIPNVSKTMARGVKQNIEQLEAARNVLKEMPQTVPTSRIVEGADKLPEALASVEASAGLPIRHTGMLLKNGKFVSRSITDGDIIGAHQAIISDTFAKTTGQPVGLDQMEFAATAFYRNTGALRVAKVDEGRLAIEIFGGVSDAQRKSLLREAKAATASLDVDFYSAPERRLTEAMPDRTFSSVGGKKWASLEKFVADLPTGRPIEVTLPAARAGLGVDDAARLEELAEKAARAAELPRDEKAVLARELANALRPSGVGVAATERAILAAPPRAAGVVPGRLAEVPLETVRRVVRDIVHGVESPLDQAQVRRMVEEEAVRQFPGRTMEDIWNANDFEALGREPVGVEASRIGEAGLADDAARIGAIATARRGVRLVHQTTPEAAAGIRKSGFNKASLEHVGEDIVPEGVFLKEETGLVRPDILGGEQVGVVVDLPPGRVRNVGSKEDLLDFADRALGKDETARLYDISLDMMVDNEAERVAAATKLRKAITQGLKDEGVDAVTFQDPIPETIVPTEAEREFLTAQDVAEFAETQPRPITTTVVLDPKNVRVQTIKEELARSLAEERRFGAMGSLRDFEDATRALRTSEDPATRARAIAAEAAGDGGGSGVGRPPTDWAPGGHLPDPAPGTDRLSTLNTFERWVADFAHTMDNSKAASFARLLGHAAPARHMLEFLNPSPWFQGRVGHALGGFLNKGQANRALHAAMTVKMRRTETGLFKFVDNVAENMRSISDPKGIVVTPEYLVQNPDDVVNVVRGAERPLTDKQRHFVDNVRSLLKQEADYEFDVFSHAEFGRPFRELTEKEMDTVRKKLFNELGVEQGKYFHREVLNVKTMEDKYSLVQRRGAAIDWSRGFQQDRQFTSMWEGMENGVQYGEGITENVMARVISGQAASLDKEVIKFLEDAGQTAELSRMIAKTQAGGAQGGIMNTMAMFNNISRPMITNADLGFMGLQVIPAASRSPYAAVRGGMMVIDALLTDQRQMASYISRQLEPQEFLGGKSWLEDFFNQGGIWNQNEFSWEYAAQSRGPASIFNRGPFRRFNNAFSGATNISSLEIYKGMVGVNDSLYRALGNRRATKLVTEAFGGFRIAGKTSRQQAASVANKLTLRMNSAALGISKGQIRGEAALMFAPRYYRAFFGLLGDALQGGMRGAEARRSMGQMAAGFLAMNQALEYIPGVEPLQLDPRKPNFFTTKIGGLRAGPGGPFVSLFSLLGKATKRDREGDFMVDLPFGLGLNPGLAKLNFDDNPLMRWGRGKLSPVASLVFDVLKGETFMYDKLDNPMDYAMLLTDRLTPFFVQAGIDAYSKRQAIKDTALAAGLEFGMGARTWPESAFDVRAAIRDRVSQDKYEKNYGDLTKDQKSRVNEDPEVVEANEAADEEALERGYESTAKRAQEADYLEQFVKTGEVKRDGEVTFSQFSTQIQDNGLFGRGELDGQDWIARYKDRQTEYHAFRGGIRTALGITFGDEEADNAVDKALDAYFDILPDQFLDAKREPMWDEYFAAKERALQDAVRQGQTANGAQGAADVKTYLAPIEDDQTVKAFKKAQDTRDALGELPKYRFLDVERSNMVDELLDKVATATAGARERGVQISHRQFLKNVLERMPKDHELYDIVAVAFLRKTADTREQLWNPERDQLVLDDPMSVKFYVSLYKNMSDANKLRFLDEHGTRYFSNTLIEEEGLNPDTAP